MYLQVTPKVYRRNVYPLYAVFGLVELG